MKSRNIYICVAVAFLSLNSCTDSWLEPKPLSFHTPEDTYVGVDGFEATLSACEAEMHDEYNGDGCAILTEMIQSDICVEGTTDKAGPQMDMDKSLLPDMPLDNMDYTRVGWYWTHGYKAIKSANIIIARIDEGKFANEEDKSRILGQAYFHRAYWYYKLVHQFGDIPWLDYELAEPKTDFYSYDRWSILEELKRNLEYSYQNVPDNVNRGKVSKSACGVLLMKINICLGYFDEAIQIGQSIVAEHPLMTTRFTSNQNKPKTNLMHDLHSVEAKMDGGKDAHKWNFDGGLTYGWSDKTAIQYGYHGLNDKLGGIGYSDKMHEVNLVQSLNKNFAVYGGYAHYAQKA